MSSVRTKGKERVIMDMTIEKDLTQRVQMDYGVQSKNSEQAQKAKETKAQEQQPEERTYDAISEQGDTLTISEAGRNAEAQKERQSEDKGQASAEDKDGVVVKKAVESAPEAEETAEKEEEVVDTTNLSQYTKVELRDLYFGGDITKTEYDEELAVREG